MSFYTLQELVRQIPSADQHRRKLPAGTTLFEQGSEVATVYFVIKGEVAAERILANGQTLTLFRAGPGEAIGEESLLFPDRLYNAIATKATEVLGILKTALFSRLESSKEFRRDILHCLSERYLDCMMHREFVQIKSAEQRILCWLKWMNEKNSDPMELNGRMGSIGSELGLTRESVYRALAKLEKAGLILREEGVIVLTAKGESKDC